MAAPSNSDVRLTGTRITLASPIDMRHAEEIAALANDIEIRDSIGAHSFPHPYSVDNAREFIDRNREMGNTVFAMDFLILYQNRPAGVIGLSDINYLDRKAHIGYWVGKQFRRKGIATEATGLVVGYAFTALKLRRLQTKVLEDNVASMKVLVNNGFEMEGIERESFFVNNRYASMILFSRIDTLGEPTR